MSNLPSWHLEGRAATQGLCTTLSSETVAVG